MVNWQGGGGYRFYELAPTLINEDSFGQKVISPDYNSDMLAAAIALHEGYKYEPDNTCYWKQSHSENNSYLWDVNNLYTIVPLRTATSKTLREQTVGRGLRLPFGKRTGEKMIDSVTITAHDKFDEIIAEAQRGDSIFNAEGVIYAEYEKSKQVTHVQMSFMSDNERKDEIFAAAGLDINNQDHIDAYNIVNASIINATNDTIKKQPTIKVNVEQVKEAVKKDIGERYNDNTDIQRMIEVMWGVVDNEIQEIEENTMFIPKIKTENLGEEKYIIQDFDLDLTSMVYIPIENDILIRNLLDSRENVQVLKGSVIDFDTLKPEKLLVDGIREVNEIDYEKCPELIQKIVMQFLTHYRAKYEEEKVRNICLMYRKDIINKFKDQLLQHLAISYDGIIEIVQGIETVINNYLIDISDGLKNINEEPMDRNIKSIVYDGAQKSVTTPYKFDSNPERLFALACDNSPEVLRWLRPAPSQFNITYNRGHRYEPDFVVETDDMYYLVEVKAKNKMNDPDVLAKKDRAIKYCKVASEYNLANGHKAFKYLFIPHDEVSAASSFNNLKSRFIEE